MKILRRLFNRLFRRGWRNLEFRGTPIIVDALPKEYGVPYIDYWPEDIKLKKDKNGKKKA